MVTLYRVYRASDNYHVKVSQKPMDAAKLKTVEQQIESLPSLSDIEKKVVQELEAEMADFRKIADWVALDPLLSARLLGLANSPYYGVRGNVTSIQMACAILGVKTMHSYILSLQFFGSIKSPISKRIVSHSFCVALFSQLIANKNNLKGDSFFTAGLLHDIGKIYIGEYYPQAAGELYGYSDVWSENNIQRETGVLGFNHVQIGVAIARHWGVPDQIVDVINKQHSLRWMESETNRVLYAADHFSAYAMAMKSGKEFIKDSPKSFWSETQIDKKHLKAWYPELLELCDEAKCLARQIL